MAASAARNRKASPITEAELRLIGSAATIGDRSRLNGGRFTARSFDQLTLGIASDPTNRHRS